jgi:hypothetical protein
MTAPHTKTLHIALYGVVAMIATVNPAYARHHKPEPVTINITFDDSAVRQLLALIAAKDSSDASVESWMNLPANAYVLKIGNREGN